MVGSGVTQARDFGTCCVDLIIKEPLTPNQKEERKRQRKKERDKDKQNYREKYHKQYAT